MIESSFQEMVSQMFSLNLVLMPSEGTNIFFSTHFPHLSMSQVFNTFGEINKINATIRDLFVHQAYPLHRLRLRFTTCETLSIPRLSQSQTSFASQMKKYMSEFVTSSSLNCLNDDEKTISYETPHYEKWKRSFIDSSEWTNGVGSETWSGQEMEHELIGAHFGCLFIITTNELSNFKELLSGMLTKVKQTTSIRWMQPDFIRFYLVISEETLSPQMTCYSYYNELISIYANSYWMQLSPVRDISTISSSFMSNSGYSNSSIDQTVKDTSNPISNSYSSSSNHVMIGGFPDTIIDPLSKLVMSERDRLNSDRSTPPISPLPLQSTSNIAVSSTNNYSNSFLPHSATQAHIDRILEPLASPMDKMLREFITRALIPWSEKQIKLLGESISQRKGFRKSFFSATKSLLNNMSSSTVGLKGSMSNSIIYSSEAPEMQQRKLGDLCMCLTLYDLAYSSYHSAKKEFQSEGAYLHYAGACESSAIASYCANKFQRHHFDQAINTYIDVCKAINYATRATIFATEIIKNLWPNEAANLFIRMTGDDSDLRSALFLEQASKCFVNAGSRSRKAAFHYVLAGHRYNRCGLKHFALACYRRFNSAHWQCAADHANLTIARLYLAIGNSNPNNTNNSFNNKNISPINSSGLTQSCTSSPSSSSSFPFADYKKKGLEILRKNANKQVFYCEFLREVKKDLQQQLQQEKDREKDLPFTQMNMNLSSSEQQIMTPTVEDINPLTFSATNLTTNAFYLQIPYIKSISIVPAEEGSANALIGEDDTEFINDLKGNDKKPGKPYICYVNEPVKVNLILVSPFKLDLNQLEFYAHIDSSNLNSNVNVNSNSQASQESCFCSMSSTSTTLEAEEESLVTLMLTPHMECDLELLGLQFIVASSSSTNEDIYGGDNISNNTNIDNINSNIQSQTYSASLTKTSRSNTISSSGYFPSSVSLNSISSNYSSNTAILIRTEISEKIKKSKSLKLRSIKTLPLIEIDIQRVFCSPTSESLMSNSYTSPSHFASHFPPHSSSTPPSSISPNSLTNLSLRENESNNNENATHIINTNNSNPTTTKSYADVTSSNLNANQTLRKTAGPLCESHRDLGSIEEAFNGEIIDISIAFKIRELSQSISGCIDDNDNDRSNTMIESNSKWRPSSLSMTTNANIIPIDADHHHHYHDAHVLQSENNAKRNESKGNASQDVSERQEKEVSRENKNKKRKKGKQKESVIEVSLDKKSILKVQMPSLIFDNRENAVANESKVKETVKALTLASLEVAKTKQEENSFNKEEEGIGKSLHDRIYFRMQYFGDYNASGTQIATSNINSQTDCNSNDNHDIVASTSTATSAATSRSASTSSQHHKYSRKLTRKVDFHVRECLRCVGITDRVVSLLNVLPNEQSITVLTQGNEPIEIPANLTAHILVDEPEKGLSNGESKATVTASDDDENAIPNAINIPWYFTHNNIMRRGIICLPNVNASSSSSSSSSSS